MTTVIDIIDAEDKYTANDIKSLLKDKGFSNFIEMPPSSNVILETVNRITHSTPLFSIKLLRFWGHGEAGMQCIAGKEYCITSTDFKHLEPLAQYFAKDALVEFHGCEVASLNKANNGEDFIQKLANLWNVRIRASTVEQKNMVDRTDWVKPVFEARPNTSGIFRVL
ncbi:DUF4347 domain-containing protein [Methylomonas methanica]|uniref:DUF4347 domain-containing protein n=1 Tax=Methylomonas methanica (strain DSM 25384 / MC09) TaxID=857087 RepID=G0A4Q7_METMM|nr:DUF4347 domain-containing protein [Methylomonas methanica]AEG02798.1 hypothetical protein Metme_4455 [Methylomonas methanica MC09]